MARGSARWKEGGWNSLEVDAEAEGEIIEKVDMVRAGSGSPAALLSETAGGLEKGSARGILQLKGSTRARRGRSEVPWSGWEKKN